MADEERFAHLGERERGALAAELGPRPFDPRFVVRALGLRPGQAVLEAFAGTGGRARALALAGLVVTAVEPSAPLLAEARRAAGAAGPPVRWLQADPAALGPLGVFAAALCLSPRWCVADGPSPLAVLRALARQLLPGAPVLVEAPHAGWLETHPHGTSWAVAGGAAVRETYRYDPATATVEVGWSVRRRGAAPWEASLRFAAYRIADLERLLAQAGLALEAAFGGHAGAPLSAAHPLILARARRTAVPVLGPGAD
jgi:SAM-dependent methyltransferase